MSIFLLSFFATFIPALAATAPLYAIVLEVYGWPKR
jgi:hypothetical protein